MKLSKDKCHSVKLKIRRDKCLGTVIDNRRYMLSDADNLVNKIDSKSISTDDAITIYNYIVEKVNKISELRQRKSRPKNVGNY